MTSPPPDLGPQGTDYGGLFSLPAPPAEPRMSAPERSVQACALRPGVTDANIKSREGYRDPERPASETGPKHLARRSDPDTSRLGAAHAAANLPALQARALSWVRRRPGLTATELAREAGEGDPRVFNRRLGELDRAGRVVRGEARRCKVTGRQAATWTAE